jgi:hypothetical protein
MRNQRFVFCNGVELDAIRLIDHEPDEPTFYLMVGLEERSSIPHGYPHGYRYYCGLLWIMYILLILITIKFRTLAARHGDGERSSREFGDSDIRFRGDIWMAKSPTNYCLAYICTPLPS